MKIYLSAPVSRRLRKEVEIQFTKACRRLRALGLEVVCPYDAQETNRPWADYMMRDLDLLSTCDALLLLDGWQHSRGCRVEQAMARSWGLLVLTEVPEACSDIHTF